MPASGRIIPFTRTSTRELDFRIIINLFNIILLVLLIVAGVIDIGYAGDYILDLIAIAAPALSIIWTTIATVLLLRSSLKPPYHPAIDLTFDAISWLLFWIQGAFLIAQVAASEGLNMCAPSYGGVPNDSFCRNGLGTRKWNIDAAASAFMMANGLIHIVFFSIACDRVKRWRRQQWGQKRESFELDRK